MRMADRAGVLFTSMRFMPSLDETSAITRPAPVAPAPAHLACELPQPGDVPLRLDLLILDLGLGLAPACFVFGLTPTRLHFGLTPTRLVFGLTSAGLVLRLASARFGLGPARRT